MSDLDQTTSDVGMQAPTEVRQIRLAGGEVREGTREPRLGEGGGGRGQRREAGQGR
jgi:hypothetical protein